jgi:hypothetical protein
MKKYIIILLIVNGLIPEISFCQNSDSQKDKERVEVVFTNKQTNLDLMNIKKDLSSKGISIDFIKLEFDSLKFLCEIDFYVNCNDGYKGKAKCNFKLNPPKKFGFYRDYSKNAKNPFRCGSL